LNAFADKDLSEEDNGCIYAMAEKEGDCTGWGSRKMAKLEVNLKWIFDE
jgi:hypothetical protein